MQNNVLSIWLWGQELGRIYWDLIQSRAVFEYNSAFISAGMDVAPLSASIHSVAAGRPILGNKDALYQGLPPFIADSLPDKWGSLVFECWAKENNIRSKDITPVDKLAFIGKRAMGALEFRPAVELAEVQEELALASLYDLAQHIHDLCYFKAPNYSIIPCGVPIEQMVITPMKEARAQLGWSEELKYIVFGGAFDNIRKNYALLRDSIEKMLERKDWQAVKGGEKLGNVVCIEMRGLSRAECVLRMCAAD